MATGQKAMAVAEQLALEGKRKNGRWERGRCRSLLNEASTAAERKRTEADRRAEARRQRKPFTPYEASRARERQAELLKPMAQERVGGRGKKATESAANLAEVPAGRETRKLAAAGTGYSGSSLDKVDKIRDAAERGIVKVGKTEMPWSCRRPIRSQSGHTADSTARFTLGQAGT